MKTIKRTKTHTAHGFSFIEGLSIFYKSFLFLYKTYTQKVTLDDLAAMIERNIAHKEDLERHTTHIENFIREENAKLTSLIEKIPTRDELVSHTQIIHRLERIEEQLHLK